MHHYSFVVPDTLAVTPMKAYMEKIPKAHKKSVVYSTNRMDKVTTTATIGIPQRSQAGIDDSRFSLSENSTSMPNAITHISPKSTQMVRGSFPAKP